jgi:hypothetical protein
VDEARSRRVRLCAVASQAVPVKKLILMSILVATIAIPARVAGDREPRLALKKTLLYSLIFNIVYWLLLLFAYGRVD